MDKRPWDTDVWHQIICALQLKFEKVLLPPPPLPTQYNVKTQ